MLKRLTLLLLLSHCFLQAFCQNNPSTSCGQKELMEHFYATHPQYKQLNNQIEKLLQVRNQQMRSGRLPLQRVNAVVTLPVVVHIIHNNGAENISDAQVFQAIQHLNEAYANTGYYDPADGVNTQIQFCMAQRDPSNNLSNGITRDVSAYTVMGGANYYSDDQNVKNINRWNPLCYINIWLVKSIPTSVVGYAYLPSAHGSNVDGIIIEAAYFGSSNANDVVAIHEMGHYLGLYHTFEGACTNNDCTSDGDKVCDTPPDQSTAGISCTSTVNSCTTDVLSGFATDQNDLTQDYMDYGNFNCMKVFTQGQSDRMNWFIQNVRKSLLACKSCMSPCPAPVVADFVSPGPPFNAGTGYVFTNTSVNAASYEWYVNGVLQGGGVNFNYIFPAIGAYTVKLIAKSGSALCDDAIKTANINVVCGAMAGFTKSAAVAAAGANINFTNTSAGADSYEWLVNGVSQSTSTNFSYTSSIAGSYIIKLIAKNTLAGCQQEYTDTVTYTCAVIAGFTPLSTTTVINTPVIFNSTGTGATTYQWLVNGVAGGSGPTFTYTFTAMGSFTIQLVAGNGVCSASKTGFVYTTDKCGNAAYLFQKNYAAGSNSAGNNINASFDGGSIVANRILKSGNTSFEAALLKLDAGGNVQWMNSYSANAGSYFAKAKPTMDAGYIAIGSAVSAGGGSGSIFLVKTLAGGAIDWSRELSAGNGVSLSGTDILQSADGSYYFTGASLSVGAINGETDAIVGKLDGTGNIIWIKTYDARSSEQAAALAENNSQIIVCGNISGQAGTTSGFLLNLNKADGSVVWGKTYQSTNDNFRDVKLIAGGYYIDVLRSPTAVGVLTDHVYLETDFAGNITYSKYIQPFGTTKTTGFISSFVKPDGNIISSTSPTTDGIYQDFLVQEISPLTGILWTKKYNRPTTWASSVAASGDKGILLSGFAFVPVTPTSQTYVMKADSVGNTGSCPSENISVELLSAQYIIHNADFNAKAIQPQVITNHVAAPVDVTTNTVCQYITCDSVITPVDTCSHITFQQEISTPGSALVANDLKISSAGAFVVGGGLTTGRDTAALLIYLNSDGSKKWAKQYNNEDVLKPLTIGKVLLGNDGSFITAGSVADSNLIVAKFNTVGDILWTKYFNGSMTAELHNAGISGIISTYDGGIAFCTYNGLVTKLDKDGNLLWSRKMGLRTNGLIQVNNELLIAGVSADLLNDLGGRLIRMNESNGTVTGTVAYGSNNAAEFTSLTAIGKNGGTYFINSLSNSALSGYSEQIIFTYDTTGVLLNISRINSIEGYGAGEITNDGVIGVLKNCFYKRNGFGNFDWSIKYPLLSSFSNLQRTPDKGFAALTVRNNNSIFLLKGDAAGRTPGCDNEPTRFLSEQVNVRINAIPLRVATDVHFITENSNHTAADINLNQAQQCLQNNCTSLKIQGFDSICTTAERVLYTVKRFTQCFLPVEWKIDTSIATIINATDSSIQIQFKKPGVHMLYGSLRDGCNIIKDSLAITVFASPKLINLGPDIQLCKFSTLKLNAGSGFASYLWNDGSVDSILMVYNIGQYFVRAEDHCGNQYFDTINIAQAPDVPFDLGPDLTTCDTDTLTITAPGNFSKYTWSANYNINTVSGSSVKVWPATDTSYSVVAEVRAGCTVVDTIHIKVGKSIPVHVGNDTSFCAGGTVLFTAPAGFVSYRWQDGSAGQAYSASQKGKYWVWATASNGCISKDTAEITQVFSLPEVKLGPDFGICINETHVFNPGSGYASYLWQDNSAAHTYSATQPGVYWVTVFDMNHCTGTDTVSITGYKMVPQHFLDSSVSVCVGRNNVLHANGVWQTYLWSTQSHSSSTPIADAGDYWLEVTNEEGCSARDTIRVIASDCTKGIYFPNAFTPNGDARNDFYRPIINGKIEKIKFIIFNRLGEKVFESSDPFKGWDGTYKGKPQDPNTFVWYCSYQFAGEPAKTEKGTVILVR